MVILKIILPLLLLPILLKGLLFVIAIGKLMSRSLQLETLELGDLELLPQPYHKNFEGCEEALLELGFHYFLSLRVKENHAAHADKWRKVSFNPEMASYAIVNRSEFKDLGLPYDVTFINFYPDHSRVATMNGVSGHLIGYPEKQRVIDPCAPSLKAQWYAHVDALEEGVSWVVKTPEQYVADENKFIHLGFEQAVERGDLIRVEDGAMSMSLKYAWTLTRSMIKGEKKRKTIRKGATPAMAQELTGSEDFSEMSDVDRFRYQEAWHANKRKMSWVFKTLLFLGSIVVFWVSFGMVFNWRISMILLCLLLFHELGHLLGMALFGYKDKQILFIPFLGAVTMGAQTNAKPYQKVAVYLLGPTPGILLGLGLIIGYSHTHAEWMWETGLIACLLNYMNLLPFMPLDGGQIIRVLLLVRAPRLQALFLGGSTLIVGISALFLKDFFLGFLFFFLIISVPYHWHLSNLHIKMKKILSDRQATRDERLHLILQEMEQPPFLNQSGADKFQITKEMLQRLSEKPASLSLILATFILYAGFLILPLLVAFYMRSSGG